MGKISEFFGGLTVNTRKEEEKREIMNGYKVIKKDSDMFLVYDGYLVISKLDPKVTAEQISGMIDDAITNQLHFMGL